MQNMTIAKQFKCDSEMKKNGIMNKLNKTNQDYVKKYMAFNI